MPFMTVWIIGYDCFVRRIKKRREEEGTKIAMDGYACRIIYIWNTASRKTHELHLGLVSLLFGVRTFLWLADTAY
jgi:hypothetical protein